MGKFFLNNLNLTAVEFCMRPLSPSVLPTYSLECYVREIFPDVSCIQLGSLIRQRNFPDDIIRFHTGEIWWVRGQSLLSTGIVFPLTGALTLFASDFMQHSRSLVLNWGDLLSCRFCKNEISRKTYFPNCSPGAEQVCGVSCDSMFAIVHLQSKNVSWYGHSKL